MTEKRTVTVVDASVNSSIRGFSNLLEYKELLAALSIRDYRVRFVQTRLGYVWAIVQPLVLIAILTFIFSRVLKVDTDNIPYPLFALSGQILWSFFSYSAVQGGQSLVQSQHMIRKIWFPRVVLPLSKAGVGLIDLGIGFTLLLFLMMGFGLNIAPEIIWVLIALAGTLITGVGISLWTSALSIKFRDVQHALPYAVQFLFFLTPVAYPTGILAKTFRNNFEWITYLNPMAGNIDLLRFGLFQSSVNPVWVTLSFGIGVLIFFSGWQYFMKVERNMADTL